MLLGSDQTVASFASCVPGPLPGEMPCIGILGLNASTFLVIKEGHMQREYALEFTKIKIRFISELGAHDWDRGLFLRL